MFGPAYVGNAVMDKNNNHLNVIQINKTVRGSEQFFLDAVPASPSDSFRFG
jgi:hypothetical protein